MKGKSILVLGLTGALFTSGLLAPDAWRSAVSRQINRLTGQAVSASEATGSTQVATQNPAVSNDKAKGAPPAVDIEDVRRPLRLAKGQHLGLGLGLFTTADATAALSAQVTKLGYKTQVAALKDESDAIWYLLIAGEYDNENDVERAQAILGSALVQDVVPDIVLVPPPPKKK